MANTNYFINQADLDSSGNVWCAGRDLTKYDGTGWTYYNYTNSVVPSNYPYFLDTRSISVDNNDYKWVGCAVTSSLSQAIVFNAGEVNAATGSSWNISEFGNLSQISPNWEIPTIYASPFGGEVLAFISPLNGGGGTGASGNVGVTGGYLWKYEIENDTWNEVAPGYIWPHIYEITANGIGGDYFDYYLSTNDGLQVIPQGTLDTIQLEDGTTAIPVLKKYNSNNSGIGSNEVYSLSFDENGHYWAGTSEGITYWDGDKFYTWSAGNGYGVTKVVARDNGHVFFRIGNPLNISVTTDGLYHFNGDTFTLYDTSNSSLPDNRVISILLSKEKFQRGGLTVLENDLWLVAGNYVVLFDYTIPHIYATSKYDGTEGWNFVYYTPSAEGGTTDAARLPKSNKYTWTLPTWTGSDLSYLGNLHPGLDTRNLFLETDLKAIADGTAGVQDYWNNGEIIPWQDQQEANLIPDYSWLDNVTNFNVTSVSRFRDYNVVTGYSDSSSIDLGEQNNQNPNFTLTNPNPVGSAGSPQNFGFVAFYSDGGQVQGAIPIRGYETKILKAQPSLDDSSLFILGSFTRYMEAGKFVWSSEYPNSGSMDVTGITGPIGGPIGFSNIGAPGLTSSYDYPWILNAATGATSGIYLPDTSILQNTVSYFIAEVDFDLGNQISYGGIDFNQTDAISSFCLKNFRYFPSISSSYDPIGATGATSPITFGNSDLSVSKNSVRITGNLAGGLSMLKNEYLNQGDWFGSPGAIFTNQYLDDYVSNGIVIDLNSSLDLKSAFTLGSTSAGSLDNIISLEDSNSYVLTGTYKGSFDNQGISPYHPATGSSLPFFTVNGYENSGITGSFIVNSDLSPSYQNWYGTIKSYKNKEQYFVDFIYTGDAYLQKFQSGDGIFSGNDGSLNIGTLSVKPGGQFDILSSYELLNESYGGSYDASISDNTNADDSGYYNIAIHYPETPGITGSANSIIRRNVSGTYVDRLLTFSESGVTGDQSQLKLVSHPDLDIFIAGSNTGSTGPSALPYAGGTGSFVAFMESYKPGVGKDVGDIISRAGSGAWTWVDVHNSSSDLPVPMLSTVFMSNYDSKIFGKSNNRWVLRNASTNEILLDVKNVPYFIYTFSQSGYFSIQNSVEDSAGNVYEISKPAFVKVVNQSIPKANDPNPEFVNSADYGYRAPGIGGNNQIMDLSLELLEEQERIIVNNIQPFGSGLVIPDNPDATFEGN